MKNKNNFRNLSLRLILWLFIFCFCPHSTADSFYLNPEGNKAVELTPIWNSLKFSNSIRSSLKSKTEVMDYFSCYLGKDSKRLKEFKSYREPYLEKAIEVLQIPFQLSSCQLFRESVFNNSAVSSQNAKSMSQFVEETYHDLRRLHKDTIELHPEYLQFLKLSAKQKLTSNRSQLESLRLLENHYVRNYQLKKKKGYFYDSKSKRDKIEGHTKAVKWLNKQKWLRPLIMQDMRSYLWIMSAELSREKRNEVFPNMTNTSSFPRGDNLIPPENFSEFVNNKMWVMLYNVYYLKFIIQQINNIFNSQNFIPTNDPILYLILVAGAYNQGLDNLKQLVRGKAKKTHSMKHWCHEMSKITETKNYMLSLRRCLTKGVRTPPVGSHYGNCQDGHDWHAMTDDPCIPIPLIPNSKIQTKDKAYPAHSED